MIRPSDRAPCPTAAGRQPDPSRVLHVTLPPHWTTYDASCAAGVLAESLAMSGHGEGDTRRARALLDALVDSWQERP